MTVPREPPPRDLPDRVIRQSLRHPANLRAFLRQAVPQLADGFDCDRARFLDRAFPLDDWRHRESDLPFEIPYRQGDEEQLALVFVLIEHQSDTDPLMPLRLLCFAVLYWERQWREWEQTPRPRPTLRLNPVLPLVLYTGATPWGSNRTLLDLVSEPKAFHAFAPTWQPIFWNLADTTPEVLLASGQEWLQMMAVLRAEKNDEANFERVYAEAIRFLSAMPEAEQVRWYDFMRILLTWAMYRRPRSEREKLFAIASAGQVTAKRQEEIQTMEMTGAEALILEGRVQAAQELLREMLEDRFGSLPPEVIRRIIAELDVNRLKAAARHVPKLAKLDDFQL
jgi:hypothetical protein